MTNSFSIDTGSGGRTLPCKITVKADVMLYEAIVKGLRHLFEIEILQGSVETIDNVKILTFITNDRHKIALLEKTLWSYFKDISGLNDTGLN